MNSYNNLEERCGYTFKNKQLLKKALTLSSFDNDFNNQSLECLGDALLSFIVAEKYYKKGASEEEISLKKQELLADAALRPVSERLGLAGALIKGKGDCASGKAVPSAYEAFVAAVYLDGGINAARKFALATLSPLPGAVNYVGKVQEMLQSRGEEPPEYIQEEGGTAQKPMQTVSVTVHGRTFSATAKNGREAKRIAAEKLYKYLNKNGG